MNAGFDPPFQGWALLEAPRHVCVETDFKSAELTSQNVRKIPGSQVLSGDREFWEDEAYLWSIGVSLREMLQEERLIAEGIPEGEVVGVMIAPQLWDNMGVDFTCSGAADELGNAFTAVKVYPALCAPRIHELLPGRLLFDVLLRFVLFDPQLIAMEDRAASQARRKKSALEGVWKKPFPVGGLAHDIVLAWWGTKAEPWKLECGYIVADRLRRLRSLLTSKIVAKDALGNTVPDWVWPDPATRFHFGKRQLVAERDGKGFVWRDPILEAREAASVTVATAPVHRRAADRAGVEVATTQDNPGAGGEIAASSPTVRRRPGQRGKSFNDRPLVAEMHELIKNGQATGPDKAVNFVVGRAEGKGTEDSKRQRLLKEYRKTYCCCPRKTGQGYWLGVVHGGARVKPNASRFRAPRGWRA